MKTIFKHIIAKVNTQIKFEKIKDKLAFKLKDRKITDDKVLNILMDKYENKN